MNRKKLLSLLPAALLLLSAAAPLPSCAEGEDEEDLETYVDLEAANYNYKVGDDGNVSLYDFKLSDSFEGELVIPSEIAGQPVTYIGNACFAESKGVTAVTIPASVTDMGDNVFFGCTALERFEVDPENTYYATLDGALVADQGKFFVAYPAGRPDTTYTVPDKIEEIAPGAFGFTENLREIIVPDGVHYIDSWAFAYSAIERAEITGSVLSIDDYAFAYCSSLSEVELKYGIESIGNASFAFTPALEQITLPTSLTEIGQYAFCGAGLTCITIPSSLSKISYCAFGYDADMKMIKSFIIYGEPYSAAADYANASDAENDYSNSFQFKAVMDASIPYELGGGVLVEDMTIPEEEPETEIGEDGEVIVIEPEPEGTVSPEEEIAAGLFGSKRLQMMLGIFGGCAVVLALVLLIAFFKKPKKSAKKPAPEEPEVSLEKSGEAEEAVEDAPVPDEEDA